MAWPFKKMRFSEKNLGKMALTPHRLSQRHKNFREGNYMFCLLAYQILAKSVKQKRRYGVSKSRPVFQKRAMFHFLGKKQNFLSQMPKIFHIDAKCPYAPGKNNGIKVCALFLPKRLKKTKKSCKFHFFSKIFGIFQKIPKMLMRMV